MSFDTQTESVLAEEQPSAVSVLIVDDEDSARNLCCEVAAESGLRARTAATTEQALDILEQFPVDILITDLRVPQLGGLELLKRVRENYPQTMVMVLTQYGTIESAVEATRLGAMDYLTKPFHVDELRAKLDRADEERGTRRLLLSSMKHEGARTASLAMLRQRGRRRPRGSSSWLRRQRKRSVAGKGSSRRAQSASWVRPGTVPLRPALAD